MNEATVQVTKRCSKCGEVKLATREFFHRHNSASHGLDPRCKACANGKREAERRSRGVKPVSPPLAERFWAKVDTSGGADACWPWRGSRSGPYGRVSIGGSSKPAHLVAWELANGDAPAGAWGLHSCDTPICCNPSHVFLGTHRDNTADKVRKGRQYRPPGTRVQKLDAAQRAAMCAASAAGEPKAKLARDFGVSRTRVSFIVARGH